MRCSEGGFCNAGGQACNGGTRDCGVWIGNVNIIECDVACVGDVETISHDITQRGHIVGLPISVTRENNLYYSKKIFTENNLTPPKTWADFITIADALKAKGIQPLSVAESDKDAWTAAILFESVMVADATPNYFADFYAGKKTANDAPYRRALEKFVQILGYGGANASTLSYTDSIAEVASGKVAMVVMGSWATADLKKAGFKPDVDYGLALAPGTEDIFILAGPGYLVSRGAKNRTNAMAFVKMLGSKEGIEAVARATQNIATRTDVSFDAIGYDAQSRTMATQFKTARILKNMPCSDTGGVSQGFGRVHRHAREESNRTGCRRCGDPGHRQRLRPLETIVASGEERRAAGSSLRYQRWSDGAAAIDRGGATVGLDR